MTGPKISASDIIAVTVIYNTNIENAVSLVTLNKSAAASNAIIDVIIYDNSPGAQDILASAFENLNCIYKHDSSNPGVSKAYNYAANKALLLKKKFLLLLDQDTSFPQVSLEKYLQALNTYPGSHLFCPILKTSTGIFSPLKYYFRRGQHWDDVKPGIYSLDNRSALNSGLLVRLSSYLSVGGFNEKIQLYFSDFDFINRFKKKFNEMVVIDLVCQHSLSDLERVDKISATRRFRYYVAGSFESAVSVLDYFYLFVTVSLRAVKLSWRYKSLIFVRIFFKKYLIEKIS